MLVSEQLNFGTNTSSYETTAPQLVTFDDAELDISAFSEPWVSLNIQYQQPHSHGWGTGATAVREAVRNAKLRASQKRQHSRTSAWAALQYSDRNPLIHDFIPSFHLIFKLPTWLSSESSKRLGGCGVHDDHPAGRVSLKLSSLNFNKRLTRAGRAVPHRSCYGCST